MPSTNAFSHEVSDVRTFVEHCINDVVPWTNAIKREDFRSRSADIAKHRCGRNYPSHESAEPTSHRKNKLLIWLPSRPGTRMTPISAISIIELSSSHCHNRNKCTSPAQLTEAEYFLPTERSTVGGRRRSTAAAAVAAAAVAAAAVVAAALRMLQGSSAN